MRVFISITLACVVWFIATQAMAEVTAIVAANSMFCCLSGQIGFTAVDSYTTQGELDWIQWDWENDGTYDVEGPWTSSNYAQQHSWSTGGLKTVKVRVRNNADPPEYDITIHGPFYIANPTIIAEPDEGWREVDVEFSTNDSLGANVDRAHAWFFRWDGQSLPPWENADSFLDAPTEHYDGPGTFLCLVYVKYEDNDNWVCSDTQVIVVH